MVALCACGGHAREGGDAPAGGGGRAWITSRSVSQGGVRLAADLPWNTFAPSLRDGGRAGLVVSHPFRVSLRGGMGYPQGRSFAGWESLDPRRLMDGYVASISELAIL